MRTRQVLQKSKNSSNEKFNISYYKTARQYLLFTGLEPYNESISTYIIPIVFYFTLVTILIPTIFELHVSIQSKDTTTVIDCMINLTGIFGNANKLINVRYNRGNLRKLLDLVAKKWNELKLNDDGRLCSLENMTARGSMFARLYRFIMISSLISFMSIPLIHPILDIISPLNETRTRMRMYKINYIIIENDDHFYLEYVHLSCGTLIFVVTILGVDSLYIIIVHHSSSLFDLTGHEIREATCTNLTAQRSFPNKYVYEQIKRSAISYNEAIQFFDILKETSEQLFFVQIGITMMGISVSAFQIAISITHPQEAIKCIIVFFCVQLHLLFISIIGQVLLNHSSDLEHQIYDSEWYRQPKQIQRMIHIMQIRSSKPCVLTAGGIYKVNVENFKSAFKTCMSYCTVLLSME